MQYKIIVKFLPILLIVFLLPDICSCKKRKGGKGEKNGEIPPAVNCLVGSPQFAVLCRLTNGTNSVLPALQGLTADQICDFDCRCVMGAQGGGKCGTSPIDKQDYCVCDYSKPAKANILNVACKISPVITQLCSKKTGVISKALNEACNADCQCSHGYTNSGQHKCTRRNGVKGNKVNYCVCEKAQNLKA